MGTEQIAWYERRGDRTRGRRKRTAPRADHRWDRDNGGVSGHRADRLVCERSGLPQILFDLECATPKGRCHFSEDDTAMNHWLTIRLSIAGAMVLIGVVGTGATEAQTTAGTSATIVVPVIAQTASFGSEVTAYNPNAGTITVNVAFYDANNTSSPGPKTCAALSLPAGQSAQFSAAGQCALPAGSNFGLLVLAELSGTQRFYGYARTQTPSGVGFSTEGFPIENFNDQLQHATGLRRQSAAPGYQTNCFVGTLGDAVSYELRLFNGVTNVQIGSTLAGSLSAYQQLRYLDVFAQAGAAAGDYSNVRAEFTNLTGATKKLIGFCTVQENVSLAADFRIAKSYGAPNAFAQGGNAFGTTALLGTADNQPLEIKVNNQRVMRYEPKAGGPNVIGGHPNNGVGSLYEGSTIAGGGQAGGSCFDPPTGTFTRSCGNRAAGGLATIGGGSANQANNFFATVAGGSTNTASGVQATVSGGTSNIASGMNATVAGGYSNTASGIGSFAIGGTAVVSHDHSFLWCDGHTTCNSQQNSDFIVVASGGIRLYTADGLGGCLLTNPAGAGWQCSSDRNLKENFVKLDALDVLRRVSEMPITRWNVKGVPGERHIGPVAQDFYAAFRLGADDLHIGSGDISGVALAAIQGLHQLEREKDVQLAAQRREIETARREIDALNARGAEVEALRDELAAIKRMLVRMSADRAPVLAHGARE
jgi:Chaperone of endosialidase